jgi:hypothetical protein
MRAMTKAQPSILDELERYHRLLAVTTDPRAIAVLRTLLEETLDRLEASRTQPPCRPTATRKPPKRTEFN